MSDGIQIGIGIAIGKLLIGLSVTAGIVIVLAIGFGIWAAVEFIKRKGGNK